MRPASVIATIILLLFTVVRITNSCSKREKRKKTRDFNEWVSKVRNKKDSIMAYRYFSRDSLSWMSEHKKSFDKTLDSAIAYYTDHYKQDEKRYKAYLNVLFEYKKLSYLYSSWIKSSRINENPAKMEKDYHLLTYAEFQQKEREILFNMGRVSIDLIMID